WIQASWIVVARKIDARQFRDNSGRPLNRLVRGTVEDDGWAPLAAVGNNIVTNQRPDFDSRSYGYGKLSDLILGTSLFETERHSPGDGKQALMYAREKPRATASRRSTGTKAANAATAGAKSTAAKAARAPVS